MAASASACRMPVPRVDILSATLHIVASLSVHPSRSRNEPFTQRARSIAHIREMEIRSDPPISRHPSAAQDKAHILRRPQLVSRRAGVKTRPPS
eukprot:3196020-Prymnesium_polylepis.1